MSSFKPKKFKKPIVPPTANQTEHRNYLAEANFAGVRQTWIACGGGDVVVLLLDLDDKAAREIATAAMGSEAVSQHRAACMGKASPVVLTAGAREATANLCNSMNYNSGVARALRAGGIPGHIDTVIVAAAGTGLARIPCRLAA